MSRGTGSWPSVQLAITDTAVLVKAGKTSLTAWTQSNTGNAVAYVRIFDAAAAADVALGTTACDYFVAAAATSFSHGSFPRPIQFTKGVVIAACTDVVTANHTAPNATQNVALALGE